MWSLSYCQGGEGRLKLAQTVFQMFPIVSIYLGNGEEKEKILDLESECRWTRNGTMSVYSKELCRSCGDCVPTYFRLLLWPSKLLLISIYKLPACLALQAAPLLGRRVTLLVAKFWEGLGPRDLPSSLLAIF